MATTYSEELSQFLKKNSEEAAIYHELFNQPIGKIIHGFLPQANIDAVVEFQKVLTALHLYYENNPDIERVNLREPANAEAALALIPRESQRTYLEKAQKTLTHPDSHPKWAPRGVPLFGELAVTLGVISTSTRDLLLTLQAAERMLRAAAVLKQEHSLDEALSSAIPIATYLERESNQDLPFQCRPNASFENSVLGQAQKISQAGELLAALFKNYRLQSFKIYGFSDIVSPPQETKETEILKSLASSLIYNAEMIFSHTRSVEGRENPKKIEEAIRCFVHEIPPSGNEEFLGGFAHNDILPNLKLLTEHLDSSLRGIGFCCRELLDVLATEEYLAPEKRKVLEAALNCRIPLAEVGRSTDNEEEKKEDDPNLSGQVKVDVPAISSPKTPENNRS